MIGQHVGISAHALVHLLTDDVYQPLKHLLHVDVVLGAGLEELVPCQTEMGKLSRVITYCGEISRKADEIFRLKGFGVPCYIGV